MSDIITRILDGDQEAVVEFYQTYSPKLLSYLSNKLPTQEDAEDILQEVFFEALDSLALFQQKSSISTWLYSIAHNKIADFYRKRKVKSLILSQLPFLQLFAHQIHDPEFQYEKNKIRDKIEQTLHQLSHKYRTILRLHYEEKKGVKEIAEDMNISFKAAESLLYRARQDFKQKYERA